MSRITTPPIAGAEEFVAWFGSWPSFHDAEVLEICLRRGGRSSLRLQVWRMTNELDSTGVFKTDRHATVTFSFDHVVDVELADFSDQNVIASLSCEPVGKDVRVRIFPSYGIGGFIQAEQVGLSFEPTNDSVSTP